MRPAGARYTSEVGCHRSEIKRSAFNCEAGISLASIARISSKESSPLPTLGYGSSNRQAASNFKLVSRHAQMRRQCRTLGCRTRIEARTSKQNTANILSSLIQSERHWGRGPSPGATWPPSKTVLLHILSLRRVRRRSDTVLYVVASFIVTNHLGEGLPHETLSHGLSRLSIDLRCSSIFDAQSQLLPRLPRL